MDGLTVIIRPPDKGFAENLFLCARSRLLEWLQRILSVPSRVHQHYLPYYNGVYL